MDTLLITGYPGFVSSHLANFVMDRYGNRFNVICTYRTRREIHGSEEIRLVEADLNRPEQIERVLRQEEPDYIVHLAAESSVSFSWKYPIRSFRNNTSIFLNLVESIRKTSTSCRLLSVGSSEQYGRKFEEQMPLDENEEQNPVSPYAIARVSQEMLADLYSSAFGLDIVMTRSFNHVGPGQSDHFVISSFAKKVLECKRNEKKSEMDVGDLSIVRDFVDVRDVCRAYVNLLDSGQNGEVYNVCSGKGYSLQHILEKIMNLADYEVSIRTDPALVRPDDNPLLVGSYQKIKKTCSWKPEIEINESLQDVLNDWKKRLSAT